MISKLSEITTELKERGEVIECGDWNSRIANHTGLLEHDESNGRLPLPDDYMSNDFLSRKSEDKSTNPYGSEFLSLVLNNNLIMQE